MKTLLYIWILLIMVVSLFICTKRSIASKQAISSETNDTVVIRVESENNYLFIFNSDTIIVAKTIEDLSIIFQLENLHKLFFQGHEFHSISVRCLSIESKMTKKKKRYFKAEGYIPNLLNQFEWLIRIENPNATRNMDLKEFIDKAQAALVEIKIQI